MSTRDRSKSKEKEKENGASSKLPRAKSKEKENEASRKLPRAKSKEKENGASSKLPRAKSKEKVNGTSKTSDVKVRSSSKDGNKTKTKSNPDSNGNIKEKSKDKAIEKKKPERETTKTAHDEKKPTKTTEKPTRKKTDTATDVRKPSKPTEKRRKAKASKEVVQSKPKKEKTKELPPEVVLDPAQLEPAASSTDRREGAPVDHVENEEDAYADDFSDYSDDDSDDDDDTESLHRHSDEASDTHGSPVLSRKTETTTKATKQPSRIDFDTAYATTTDYHSVVGARKRWTRISKLVAFDSSVYDILDMADNVNYVPLGEAVGAATSTQTGDAGFAAETQTDERACSTAWTQHPIVGRVAAGTCPIDESSTSGVLTIENPHAIADSLLATLLSSTGNERVDTLTEFVQRTARLIGRMLDDEEAEGKHDTKVMRDGAKSELAFASTVRRFDIGQLGEFASLQAIALTEASSSTAAVVGSYGIAQSPMLELNDMSMLCRWALDDKAVPEQVYQTEGEVTSVCLSPDANARVVFAGLTDGSMCAWDSEEPRRQHRCSMPWPTTGDELVLRSPSYTTRLLDRLSDDTRTTELVHACITVATLRSTDTPDGSTICQVVGLTTDGRVHIYVCVCVDGGQSLFDSARLSETDVGLAPMSRVKLVHVTTLHTARGVDVRATAMACSNDALTFYVGTTDGTCVELTRSSAAARRTYESDECLHASISSVSVPRSTDVTAPDVMAVSDECGGIRLHRRGRAVPSAILPTSAEGAQHNLLWSPLDACQLFAVDAESVSVYNLTKSIEKPSHVERFTERVVASTVSSNGNATLLALGMATNGVHVHSVGHKEGKRHGVDRLNKLLNSV